MYELIAHCQRDIYNFQLKLLISMDIMSYSHWIDIVIDKTKREEILIILCNLNADKFAFSFCLFKRLITYLRHQLQSTWKDSEYSRNKCCEPLRNNFWTFFLLMDFNCFAVHVKFFTQFCIMKIKLPEFLYGILWLWN